MKKKITLGFAFFCFFITAKAQVYEKGNMLFDIYYGAPNLYTSVFQGYYNDPGAGFTNTSATSLGPWGIKAEYLVSQKIGIGLHFNDAHSKVSGTYSDYTGNYTFTAKSNVMRVYPTINIHMGNSSLVDPYFSFGIGNNNRSTTYTNSDPYGSTGVTIGTLVPVATRAEFGMRFFFTEN